MQPGAAPHPDRRHPFAFVADLDAPELSEADHHHLARARRLRDGAPLTVGDGAGRFRPVRFGTPLVPAGDTVAVPAPSPLLTIGFALTKGDKPELVVQKLVEIGVDRIVPFTAERSIVRWDATKAHRNVARWRVIAREAAAQAHRPWLAEVTAVSTFAEAAGLPGATLAHPDAHGWSGAPGGDGCDATVTTVLVGPEGGWSTAEEAAVARRVGLGPHILRAETAALVAGARIVAKLRT